MPDLTAADRARVDSKRIVKFGNEATLIFYNELGKEIVRLESNWFIEKTNPYQRNATGYRLTVVEEEDVLLNDAMASVKSFRYFLEGDDTKLSERYLHNGIDNPDLGENRTWVIGINKEKFKNMVFEGI